MVTPRSQPPLPVELRPERPVRLSQTWLTHYQRCKRSALLYLKYRGAVTGPQMERGSLFHEVVARLTNEALDNGWTRIPHEVAKAALFEVYAEGDFTVPATEWDHVRRCVFNWAEHTKLDPDKILGVEILVVLDIGGWRVSGKIDLAWRDGVTVAIRDYKTSPAALTQEAFNNSMQQKVYSLLAAYGQPVTVEKCADCLPLMPGFVYLEGEVSEDGSERHVHGSCPTCNGKGYTETLEPYALGEGAQHFDIAEVYPALAFDDGGLMERQRTMSRAELLDERSMLEALLSQITKSFDSGEWPAVPSDDACEKCACRRDCPLPNQLLPFDGIETAEEAEHYALAMDVLDRERKDIVKALKAWVKNGAGKKNPDAPPRPILLGNGLQLNFVPVEVNETDYNGFREAQAAGKVVDLEQFKSKRIQTSFKAEPMPEPAEAPESRDFGDEAPWTAEDLEAPPSASHGGSNAAQTDLSGAKDAA